MAGYSQFLEMSLTSEREMAEVVVFCDGFEYSGRMVEILDFKGLHIDLWSDLMDCNEDADMTGEIRINGKTILTMRKSGNDVS